MVELYAGQINYFKLDTTDSKDCRTNIHTIPLATKAPLYCYNSKEHVNEMFDKSNENFLIIFSKKLLFHHL